jgi:hypothetical protein
MARTYKDKNPIYRRESQKSYSPQSIPNLKRRFLNFKKSGPPVDGDVCPECGGLTDFRQGFLTCSECGWTEDVVEMFEMERFAA